MLDDSFVERIAGELSLRPEQVAMAIRLLDGGSTTSFVARYRKDVVGNLTEQQLEAIAERNSFYIGVVNRRRNLIEASTKAGTLTDEFRARIEACFDKAVLEDLYAPFKPKRRTKASAAEDQGLAPLADFLLKQLPGLQAIEEFATAFVKPEKSVSSPEEALEGARYIIVETLASDPETRSALREHMLSTGVLTARATKNAESGKTKYETYYNFSEPLSKVPSHRMLALLRGAKEGVLRLDVVIDDEQQLAALATRQLREPAFEPILRPALNEAYTRHLRPAIESEVMDIVRRRAEDEAIRVCRENVAGVLMAAPAGAVNAVGLVPAPQKPCKVAVIDATGAVLETAALHLNGAAESEEGLAALGALMDKHAAYAVAISNGPGARETAKALAGLIREARDKGAFVAMLNPGPANAYAGSRTAREECQGLDTETREAVSTARRLQNPLAELVKVEPRSIGTGQYQHDVNQKQLREALNRTVSACVNRVGVDLNTASADTLRYVSGLQGAVATALVAKRAELGAFASREQLHEVDGIGPKVFEQCAGFLRIMQGASPLDATAIHPEIYPLVERIARSVELSVAELIGNADAVAKVDFDSFATEAFGVATLADVRAELLEPGKDPRGQFKPPRFLEGVGSIDDLQEGMEIEGVVTNVTDFGAFVNIGVQQDGLVHLSELSSRFVKDPREVIKVGDVVRVKVIKVDRQAPRISLSMKALHVRPKRAEGARDESRRRAPRPAQAEGAAQGATPGAEGTEAPARRSEPRGRRPEGSRERSGEPHGEGRRGRPKREEKGEQAARGRGERPDRKSGDKSRARRGEGGEQKASSFGDTGSLVNTLLAEQLAALRGKIGS